MSLKRYFIIAISSLFSTFSWANSEDQIIASIAGTPIYESEFLFAYNKSNTTNKEQLSLNQFLDNYINFKLKTIEAQKEGLDKKADFKNEYNSYLTALQRPYLEDSIACTAWIRSIYDRSLVNLEVLDIFIPFEDKDFYTPTDTLDAYKKAQKIYLEIKNKPNDFESIEKKYSSDFAVIGTARWITSLMTELPYENAVYQLNVDEVSKPIRGRKGYYIVKLIDKQADKGSIRMSDLFIPYPQNATETQRDSIKQLAQKIADELKNGADFKAIYMQYGELDRVGDLGENGYFNVRRPMNNVFASAIENVPTGSYSDPIDVGLGFDIVKVTERIQTMPTFEKMKNDIIDRVKDSDYIDYFKLYENNALKIEYPYTINNITYNKILDIDSKNRDQSNIALLIEPLKNESIVNIGNKEFYIKDFIDFINQDKGIDNYFNLTSDRIVYSLNNYIYQLLLNEKKENLYTKYPDLEHIAAEYYDGLLYFNIMSDKVWNKAQNDTEQLEQYYTQNKDKYKWNNPKYEGYLIFVKDENTKKKTQEIIKKNKKSPNLATILKDELNTNNEKNIIIEYGFWGKGENQYIDETVFDIPSTKTFIGYPIFFFEGKAIKQPRNINDVRGLVIADYQDLLDKEWLSELKLKYPITINEDVLKNITTKLNYAN